MNGSRRAEEVARMAQQGNSQSADWQRGGRRVSRKVSNRSDGRAVYLHMGRWTEVKAWGQVSELHCVDRRGSDESCPPFSRTEIEQMLYKGRSAAARSGWSDYLKEADVFRGDV